MDSDVEKGTITLFILIAGPVLLLLIMFVNDYSSYVRTAREADRVANVVARHALQAALVNPSDGGACSAASTGGSLLVDQRELDRLLVQPNAVLDSIVGVPGRGFSTDRSMLELAVIDETGNVFTDTAPPGSLRVQALLTVERNAGSISFMPTIFTVAGDSGRLGAHGVANVGYCGDPP